MPIEDSVFQLHSKCFSIYFWNKFCKNTFAKASSTDLVWLLQVSDQNESKRNGDRVVRWPTLTFKSTCFPIYGIWPWPSRQVNCPLCKTADWPLPLDIQIWKFKGVCLAQIISNFPDSLQTHGNVMEKFHNPLLQYKVAGEYYSHVLEYFSGPNMTI